MDILAAALANTLVALLIIFVLPTITIITIILYTIIEKPEVIRYSDLFVALLFAPIFFFILAFPLGMIVALALVALGILGAMGKLEPIKDKMCCLSPGICNYTCFILILFAAMTPVAGVGIAVGLIVLLIILAIVMFFGGGPALAAAAPEAAILPEAGEAAEGGGFLQRMGAMGKDIQARGGEAFENFAANFRERFGIGGDDEMVKQIEEMQTQEAQRAESSLHDQIQMRDSELAEADADVAKATPEERPDAERRRDQLRKEVTDLNARARKISDSVGAVAKEAGKTGKRFLGAGKHLGTFTELCIVIFLIFLVFISLVYLVPETSPLGRTLDGARNVFNSLLDNLARAMANVIETIVSFVKGQVTACEIGTTGVVCQKVESRPCEPFCISDTGKDAQWKGFKISQLKIVPSSLFDYQKFSILAEFVNEGHGDAQFQVLNEPTFGFYMSGGKLKCEWGLGGIIFWEPPCRKVFPIRPEQYSVKKIVSGQCALPGGEFPEKPNSCELEPGRATRISWFGFDIEENAIRKGITVKPEVTVNLDYSFIVPNDLVGTVAVQTFAEQLASETDLSKEKRIVKKINKAYSPPGPLMIAMGHAEEQVVSSIPTLFLVQFTNKGKGTVHDLEKEHIKLYLHPDFTPLPEEGLCDFSEWKKVSELGRADRDVFGKTEFDYWNPGPGFENYIIYEPKKSLPGFGKTKTLLDTPTLFCVLDTPNLLQIQTYDAKVRVSQYGYTESKRAKISITGTALDITKSEENTKSFSLDRCSPLLRGSVYCGYVQTVEFDKEYEVTKIIANARHGGNDWLCAWASVRFTAKDAAGNSFVLQRAATDDNGNLVHYDTTESIPPQGSRGITQEFESPVKIKSITASIVSHDFGFGCPYIDDVNAVITLAPPPEDAGEE